MFKKSLILVTFTLSTNLSAADFQGFETSVIKIGGYAATSNYTREHCIITFDRAAPTACPSKTRGIIYLVKRVGSMMCSIALTAQTTGKKITVYSDDACDTIHKAPVIRWIEIKAE